jgi:hypothetical protein
MTVHRNFITPVGRASYANVWEPKEMPNGEMMYSVAILFPKGNEDDIKSIKRAIMSAAKEKWGEDKTKWPKQLDNPLRDGDVKADDGGGDSYRGNFFLNTKAKVAPGIVGPNAKPLMNQDDFYSGCWCRAQINLYGYDKAGNKGVGVGLSNLMKVKDDDRLDNRMNATDAFSTYAQSEDDSQPSDTGGSQSSSDDDFFDD